MSSCDPFKTNLPAGTRLRHISHHQKIDWNSEQLAWFSVGDPYQVLIQNLSASLPKFVANIHFKLISYTMIGRTDMKPEDFLIFTAIPADINDSSCLFEHILEITSPYEVTSVVHEMTQNVAWSAITETAMSRFYGEITTPTQSTISSVRHYGKNGLTACIYPDHRLKSITVNRISSMQPETKSRKLFWFSILPDLYQRIKRLPAERQYWRRLSLEPDSVFKREQFKMCSQPYQPTPSDNESIRIWNWNVHCWCDVDIVLSKTSIIKHCIRESSSLSLIKKQSNADIICLQEVVAHPSLLNKMFKGWKTVFFAPTKSIGRGFKFGNLILSKYAATSQRIISLGSDPVKAEQRNLLVAKIETPHGTVNVGCTHLDVWDKTGQTRLEMKTKIEQYIESNTDSFVLCGDMNAAPDTFGTINSLSHHKVSSKPTCWFQTEVDQIHSRSISDEVRTQVLSITGSDHWLIETDIKI